MKKIFGILITISISVNLYAQTSENDSSDYFLAAFDYASNTNTFGVTLNEVKQPNYLFSGMFISRYKFDLSYAAIITDNADKNYSEPATEHNFGIGYTIDLSKNIYLYASYTHLEHSSNSFALKSVFSDIAQFDANFFSEYYSASITASYIWGRKNMVFVSVSNAMKYSFQSVISRDDLLTVQFGVGANLSDINYYNSIQLEEFTAEDLRKYLFERGYINNPNYNPNGYSGERLLNYLKNEILTRRPDLFESNYKLSTIDLYLPVYYSIQNFMFSVTPYLTFPTANNDLYEQNTAFQLVGGVSYFFEL